MSKSPRGFLTNQCKAIRKAIANLFPDIPHILCLWPILQNAWKSLGSSRKNFKDIEKCMLTVVHDSLSTTEFDEAWRAIVENFKLEIILG